MPRSAISTLGLVVILLVIAAVPPSAYAQNRGFITFDKGADSAAISLPGVVFTNDRDSTWLYGDVRTNQYNAPYGEDCLNRPPAIARPVCEYMVSGNGFAWLGTPLARSGRATFTQGTATYVEASFSTNAPIQMLAYDATDEIVGVATVARNTATGRLDRIRIAAPAGRSIAYVVFKGEPNFWLMDDFATDAPGVPNQLPAETPDPAKVVVTQRIRILADPTFDQIAVYTLIFHNRGSGRAQDTTLVLPFDPAALRIIDAEFSRPGAWVAQLLDDSLTIRSGEMASEGGTVVATIRFALLSGAQVPADLGDALAFRWSDPAGGGSGRSNRPVVVDDAGISVEPLVITPAAGAATTRRQAQSDRFIPGEPVAFWMDTPQGTVGLGQGFADANGVVTMTLILPALPSGAYVVVAYGHWSALTVRGVVQISP